MKATKTTKELAKELGLLRKRALSLSTGKPPVTETEQAFSHLIVIDFESTCWQDAKFQSQEIIEFPAVLLNTRTGEIEDEFHYFVQPQEQPVLSSFCTQLTGITQDQVDGGIPISLCLKKFVRWLDKVKAERGVVLGGAQSGAGARATATCVTWSDWDLGVCLQYECKRKQLLKPPQLTSWIDLRATYRKFYERKPNGLNGALQDLGITFQGRQHSGLDDAKNTAKLAYRMILDGCVLHVTKSLKGSEATPPIMPAVKCPKLTTLNVNSKRLQTPEKSATRNKRQKVGTPSKIPVPKRITPNKLSAKDIYTDPGKKAQSVPVQVKSPDKSLVKTGAGLKVQDTNVYGYSDNLNGSYVGKNTPVKQLLSSNSDSTFKKPSPVCKKKSNSPNTESGRRTASPASLSNPKPGLGTTDRASNINQIHTPNQSTLTKYFTPASKQCPSAMTTPSWKTPATRSSYFTTPQQTPVSNQGGKAPIGQFKTPNNQSTMKVTPPLCNCSRRSKRRMVQSPGQNLGRFFFTCAIRHGVSKKGGCEFFKWESTSTPSRAVSQRNASVISKQFTPVGNQSSRNYSLTQKKSLGVRSVTVSVTPKLGLR